MSTPNPAQIIEDVAFDYADASPNQLAAHAVSRLADAGYSIVPRRDIVRIYRAASTLGPRYMMPAHFGADLEEAERWFALQQKALDGLPGVDTVRLEYRDELDSDWNLLESVSSCTQHDRAYQ